MIKIFILFIILVLSSCLKKNRLDQVLHDTQSFPVSEINNCKLDNSEKVRVRKFSIRNRSLRITGSYYIPSKIETPPVVIFFQGFDGRRYTKYCKGLKWEGALARRGYAVFTLNYRGLGGSQGKDEWGGDDIQDFVKLISILSKANDLDVKNLFFVAFSRGGVVSLRTIQEGVNPRAAAIIGGVSDQNLQKKWEKKHINNDFLSSFGIYTKKEYNKRSPIKWIDDIDVPLFIIHGENDVVVDPKNSDVLKQKMEKLGKKFRFKSCEGLGHHCVAKDLNNEELFNEIDTFFKSYILKRGWTLQINEKEKM